MDSKITQESESMPCPGSPCSAWLGREDADPIEQRFAEWAADLIADKRALRAEVERLRTEIDRACNALTDSICVSGNDARTNVAWVNKLRATLDAAP
jgi:hypothetical protein